MLSQLSLDLVMYLCYHLQKCVFNVRRVEGARFYEGHVSLLGVLLGFLEGDLAPIFKITFIAN